MDHNGNFFFNEVNEFNVKTDKPMLCNYVCSNFQGVMLIFVTKLDLFVKNYFLFRCEAPELLIFNLLFVALN